MVLHGCHLFHLQMRQNASGGQVRPSLPNGPTTNSLPSPNPIVFPHPCFPSPPLTPSLFLTPSPLCLPLIPPPTHSHHLTPLVHHWFSCAHRCAQCTITTVTTTPSSPKLLPLLRQPPINNPNTTPPQSHPKPYFPSLTMAHRRHHSPYTNANPVGLKCDHGLVKRRKRTS